MYQRDVFIAGSGVSGLYAAIILSKMGVSVHIATTEETENKNEMLVFSPRSLQLLSQLDLLQTITQRGIRHWKFEVYQNKGLANNAVSLPQQSFRLWENETTEYNYCISCSKAIVIEIFREYLEKVQGVVIDQNQEIIHIEEKNQNVLSNAELSLYYQYRPLPMIHQTNDRVLKSIHLREKTTKQVQIWKSFAILGADGQTSSVRQKLGVSLVYKQPKQTRVFYTLVIDVVSTNFPGIRQISTISKSKDILYILGHQTHLNIIFEHKTSWSKLSIDDEIPVSIAMRHVKCVLEPYIIEFGKVRNYYKWNGNSTNSCEEYNIDSSYFLIGSAAQSMNPAGLFDINTNLEQVQNLCWKLALHIQHCASPKLLDTFEPETRQKIEESIHLSTLFTNLIGDYYKQENNGAQHSRDLLYELKRFKERFLGTTPLESNILNLSIEEEDVVDDKSSTTAPSFEFVGPVTHTLTDQPGCLAPNSKLKPYTLFQLLLLTSQTNKPTPSLQLTDIPESAAARKRSNSVTSTSRIWSSIPLFQKSTSGKKRNPVKETIASSTSALTNVDRWKSIKPNYLQLIDRIQSFNKNACTFTLLLFCGSIHETLENTGTFVRQMESPGSFLYRYERGHFDNHRNSVISSSSPSPIMEGRRSLDQSRRESFESIDPSRFSTSSMSSQSSYNNQIVSNRLFSVVFITSSSRNEAIHYLNNTPPATVHSTFPSGLAQVFLDHDGQCYKAYNVGKQSQVIVIRPDGYIGTRVSMVNEEEAFDQINLYFNSFLRPPVDMNTAAAVVAADYDC